MAVIQALQSNGELHIAGSHNVLDLEVLERGREVQLLDDFSILQQATVSAHIASTCLAQAFEHLKLVHSTENSWMTGSYISTFLAAVLACSSLFAPVQTW